MRILDLTPDSLFIASSDKSVEVVHCPTGRAILHSGCPRVFGFAQKVAVLRGLLGAIFGRYDWLVLPPMHVGWQIANSAPKRFIKASIRFVSKRSLAAKIIRRLLTGGNARIAVVDNSDLFTLSEELIGLMRPECYFVLNLTRDQRDKYENSRMKVLQIPIIISDAVIDSLRPAIDAERPYDIFISGTYHHEQRIRQLQAAKLLTARGYKVLELKERGFNLFRDALHSCRFGFSGSGLGYFCNRPFEIAAAGAVPIVHEPDNPHLIHPFVDKGNCFLYSSNLTPEQIADYVEKILLIDRASLKRSREGAMNLINSNNRSSVLAEKLIKVLISIK